MAQRNSHRRSRSLSQIVDSAWNWTSESVSGATWNPLASLAQSSLIKTLNKIVEGRLVLKFKSEEYVFGDTFDKTVINAEVVVKKDTFWTRILLSMDLGLAESYMFGDFDCDDLLSLLRIIIMNRRHLVVESAFTKLITAPQTLSATRLIDSISTSRTSLPTQSDLGDTFFAAFLSEDMNHSSAIFRNYAEDLTIEYPIESLEDAQTRKMMHIVTKAKLKRGHRVLEIGSGWGAWSILAARTTGCFIDTIALSAHQQKLANQRIKEAGLSAQIKVHFMDFRDCMKRREWEHSFDRFISMGALETFGREKITEFWRLADWALTNQSGVGIVQVITLADARIDKKGGDFIQKWSASFCLKLPFVGNNTFTVFPGSYIPSYPYLTQIMNSTSEGRLTTDSVSNIGPHCARTFREWKRKFLRNFEFVIVPFLKTEHQLGGSDIEWFKRKWTYFFDYCETGFATRNLGNHIIAFTRDGNEGFGCDFDPSLIPNAN